MPLAPEDATDAALASLLSERQGALAAGVEAALLAQDAPHYRGAPGDERRARVGRLVEVFLESVRAGGPAPFVAHVRAIAGERAAEGYPLAEVQHALSALEAQAWPLVAGAGGETDTVVRRLALVTGIVGRGKDELARAFLAHKERAEARAAELAGKLERLFAGTDAGPDQS
jgi:hypothetical protein